MLRSEGFWPPPPLWGRVGVGGRLPQETGFAIVLGRR